MTKNKPENLPVPFNLRLPWFYKRQLQVEANKQHVSLHALLLDAIERKYPPKP